MFPSKNNEFTSQKKQDELEEMDEKLEANQNEIDTSSIDIYGIRFAAAQHESFGEEMDVKPEVVQDEIVTNSIDNTGGQYVAAQPDYSEKPKLRNPPLSSDRYRTTFNKPSKVAAEEARADLTTERIPQKSNSTFKSDLSPCKKEPDASIIASSDATHGRPSLECSSPVGIRKRKRSISVKKCSDTSKDIVAGPSGIRPPSDKQGVKAYVCPRCPAEFPKTQDFEVHFEIKHGGEQRLSLEDVSRLSRGTLERSANVEESLDTSEDINVSGIRPRSLPKKKFAKDEALDLSHRGEMPFVCNVCTKRFAEKSTLMSHCKTHTGKKSFVCKVCAKEFTRKDHLQRHTRIHTGEKSFVCEVCAKDFTQNESLQRHKRVHNGEKSFVCEVCAKAFTQKQQLQRHKRVHNGEKPFVCNVCSKEFTQNENLQRHKRVHNGEKPFVCEVCAKEFSLNQHLQRHKKVHNGEKLFVCEVCAKEFTLNQHLQRHKKVHNGEKPFVCEVCAKEFTRKDSLQRHYKTH